MNRKNFDDNKQMLCVAPHSPCHCEAIVIVILIATRYHDDNPNKH